MQNIYEVFTIARGTRLTKKDQKVGNIPFTTAGIKNDGLKQKISNEGLTAYKNCITIDMFGFVKYRNYTFFCDDNIITLTPKLDYSDNEMVYFALCLARQTKGKYDYGRQCRLKNITDYVVPSPDEIPTWVYEMEIPTFDDISEAKNTEGAIELPPTDQWLGFKYEDIFNMTRGQGGTATEAKKNPGTNYYVGASDENNGITQYTSLDTTEPANRITVANNGSVGAAFYQSTPFLASSDVTVLSIKERELTPAIAMFLITLIRQEAAKINYGRKWGISRMKESIIYLPATENGQPNWQLMEDYINSLPYSKYL
jgi:hypothetical protein